MPRGLQWNSYKKDNDSGKKLPFTYYKPPASQPVRQKPVRQLLFVLSLGTRVWEDVSNTPPRSPAIPDPS